VPTLPSIGLFLPDYIWKESVQGQRAPLTRPQQVEGDKVTQLLLYFLKLKASLSLAEMKTSGFFGGTLAAALYGMC
jgi:hypothetical protein